MKITSITIALLLATCVVAQAHDNRLNWSFCTNGKLNATCMIYDTYDRDENGLAIDVDCVYLGGWNRVQLEQPKTGGNPKYPPTLIRTIC